MAEDKVKRSRSISATTSDYNWVTESLKAEDGWKWLMKYLAETDPELFDILEREANREESTIELIASENFTSKAVMEMVGGVMTNKYAEGYPGRRYYGGCEVVDEAENMARDRLKIIWGRICKCPTTFRFSGKYGSFHDILKAR